MKFILTVDKAAKSVGLSRRHFIRRYNEQDGGKIAIINRKAFVMIKDLEKWKAAKREVV